MASWSALRMFGKELRLANEYGSLHGDEVVTAFSPPGAPRLAHEGRVPLSILSGPPGATGPQGPQGDPGDGLLDASPAIASLTNEADVVATAGYETYADAGGSFWKRLPVGTIPDTLTYFRKQDFDGNYYEAVNGNVIKGEQVGIFGEGVGVDVGENINDVLAWLGDKGGGRLILPPGICHSDNDLVCDRSGIWLQGTVADGTGGGTTLHLPSERSFNVSASVMRYMNKFSDFSVQQAPDTTEGTAYFFKSGAITSLKFRDIYLRNVYGFHQAGSTGNLTQLVFYESMHGNLSAVSEHFLSGLNVDTFYMSNLNINGHPSTPNISSFINIPVAAFLSPDGVNITNTTIVNFGLGLNVGRGATNILLSNCRFEQCRIAAIRLAPDLDCSGIRISNCYFTGLTTAADLITQVGIHISAAAGTVSRFEITGSWLRNFGQHAIAIGDGANRVLIANNQFGDNCYATDDTGSVIIIAPLADHMKISDNQIYKYNTSGIMANRPKYGVNIGSAFNKQIEVTNNQISSVATSAIANPNRGDLATRKVWDNTGQVLEGRMVTVGPWIEQNVAAGVGDAQMNLAAASVPFTFIHRRAQLVAIYARGSASVTGGIIKFTANIDNVAQTLFCQAGAGEVSGQFCSKENLLGIEMTAGQSLGVHIHTTTISPSASTDWAVYMVYIFD